MVVTWESTRGAQGPGPGRARLGGDVVVISEPASVPRLAREAPAPLLLVRGGWPPAAPPRVVVPLDLLAGPWRVGPAVLAFAHAHGADVVLLALGDPVRPSFQASVDEAERSFAEAGADVGVGVRLVLAGRAPLQRIVRTLEAESPDVIALATQPRSPSSIGGATSEQLLMLLLDEGTTSLLVVGDQADGAEPIAPPHRATRDRVPSAGTTPVRRGARRSGARDTQPSAR